MSIQRLTFMESKILELGKKQHDKGYQGGTFTPGFIRKETEYGYRAINIALESLIAQELVEKSVSHTFRKGELVELDVYKITESGIAALEGVSAGKVEVNGGKPAKTAPFTPEPSPKTWDDRKPRYDPAPKYDSKADAVLEQSVRALESTVRALASDMKVMQARLDALQARAIAPPAAPKVARVLPPKALSHRLLILKAVNEMEARRKNVLSEDVKEAYLRDCAEHDIPPKGKTQFTTFLKRLEAEGLLALKRVGCKNLGIKGQGSRVVVSMAPGGAQLLEQHG